MPGKASLPFGTRALFVSGLLALTASCASTGPSSNAQGGSGSGGSAPPAGIGQPGPPSPSASDNPAPAASGCATAPTAITARVGEQPPPVCLPVGGSLTITTQPSQAQPWQPMTTSDAAILACSSQPADHGALTATCRALQSGTATVSTTTAPVAGDPHGPAQYTWTLTVHVQPAS